MATLIPSLNNCLSKMTSGEKRFAERIIDKLEDDYWAWYNIPVGSKTLYPDFIILHPSRGLLVLEVKDWSKENIVKANKETFTIRTEIGDREHRNPLRQAREYVTTIVDLLKRNPQLKKQEGEHKGSLLCPWGHGVILPNMTRKDFESTDIGEVLEPSHVICKDEMTESMDTEKFQSRLWQMFSVHFKHTLTMPQIERIRWNIFPDMRFEQQEFSFKETIPDIIRVMDLQQEQLARNLGDKHRVIHGVAGSGKTMILVYRAQQLVQTTQKPILILCFNKSLAAKLKQTITEKGLSKQVSVLHFHGWCVEQLKQYNIEFPEQNKDSKEYINQLVQKTISGVDRGLIPTAQYGAVLIDEGHDFKPEWLRLVVQMIDTQTNSLLLLYDDAQSIYEKKQNKKFTFTSVGIQARGRTTILRLNYRNTIEIMTLAYQFAKESLMPHDANEDEIPVIAPESAGRHGAVPKIIQLSDTKSEINHIIKSFREFHDNGISWNEMAIIYKADYIGKQVIDGLKNTGIPYEWLHGIGKNYNPITDSIKVVNIRSSKGLEFPVVAIPGVGYLTEDMDATEETRLLYVGMTRAMDHLIMTYHKESVFTQKLVTACKQLAA